MNQYAITGMHGQYVYNILGVNHMPIVPLEQQEDANGALDGAIEIATKRVQEANDIGLAAMFERVAALSAMKAILKRDLQDFTTQNIFLKSQIKQLTSTFNLEQEALAEALHAKVEKFLQKSKLILEEFKNTYELFTAKYKIESRGMDYLRNGRFLVTQRLAIVADVYGDLHRRLALCAFKTFEKFYSERSEVLSQVKVDMSFTLPTTNSINQFALSSVPQSKINAHLALARFENPVLSTFEQRYEAKIKKIDGQIFAIKQKNKELEAEKDKLKALYPLIQPEYRKRFELAITTLYDDIQKVIIESCSFDVLEKYVLEKGGEQWIHSVFVGKIEIKKKVKPIVNSIAAECLELKEYLGTNI